MLTIEIDDILFMGTNHIRTMFETYTNKLQQKLQ